MIAFGLAILNQFAFAESSKYIAVEWELENYNDWNLPFAKTVTIEGKKTQDPSYTSDYAYELPLSMYKLEVDPSALFSILFLDHDEFNQMNIPTDSLKTLNYTFFGDETLVEREGAWVDISMQIDHSDDPADIGLNLNTKDYDVDLTIFVAKGNIDNGLNGTLSVCVTPNNDNWSKVSLMDKLQSNFNVPTIYVQYKFEMIE